MYVAQTMSDIRYTDFDNGLKIYTKEITQIN
jgi:hypothetical protein